MTLQEQHKKATTQWFDTTECEEVSMRFATGFAMWISENMYEDYWSIEKFKDDLNDNKETIYRTWISLNDISDEVGEEEVICYTLQDLLLMYKFENNL